MGNVLPLNDPGDGFQGCPDETIAWRVDGEFVEPACHQASIHQLMAFGGQDIDPAPHAIEDCIPRTIAKTQAAALPDFNRVGKDLRDQIRQIVRAVLQADIADAASAEQVRRVEHQQPEIAHRNASDVAICVDGRALALVLRPHPSPALKSAVRIAFCASSGASNQYSSSNGPISVSTTCWNHFFVSPASSLMCGCHIAVTNPELLAKACIRRDLFVQFGDTVFDIRDQARIDSTLLDHPLPPNLAQSWLQPTKAKRRRNARSTSASDRSAIFIVPTT